MLRWQFYASPLFAIFVIVSFHNSKCNSLIEREVQRHICVSILLVRLRSPSSVTRARLAGAKQPSKRLILLRALHVVHPWIAGRIFCLAVAGSHFVSSSCPLCCLGLGLKGRFFDMPSMPWTYSAQHNSSQDFVVFVPRVQNDKPCCFASGSAHQSKKSEGRLWTILIKTWNRVSTTSGWTGKNGCEVERERFAAGTGLNNVLNQEVYEGRICCENQVLTTSGWARTVWMACVEETNTTWAKTWYVLYCNVCTYVRMGWVVAFLESEGVSTSCSWSFRQSFVHILRTC